MPSANTKLSAAQKERSAEAELLLCCARTQVDDETAARIQDLVETQLDWSSLLQIAKEHMVLPLLHRTLSEVAPNAAPSAVQDRLRAEFHANVRNSLYLTNELLDLLELFGEHDIPVVPFKGPVAATSIYDSLHLRPFGDLDLLVHLKDVPSAQTLLLNHKFEDWDTLPPVSALAFEQPPSWYSVLRQPYSKAKNFVRTSGQGKPVVVELHWELMPPYFRHPLDPDSFWQRLQTVMLNDTHVRTFSPEDMLFYFCLHGTVHRWNRLRLICDVAELLRDRTLDWDQLQDQASRLQSKRLFSVALRLAHELLGAPLPASIRHRAYSHGTVGSLTERLRDQLFNQSRGVSRIWNAYTYHMQIRDRLRDGIGACIGHAFAALPTYFQIE